MQLYLGYFGQRNTSLPLPGYQRAECIITATLEGYGEQEILTQPPLFDFLIHEKIQFFYEMVKTHHIGEGGSPMWNFSTFRQFLSFYGSSYNYKFFR